MQKAGGVPGPVSKARETLGAARAITDFALVRRHAGKCASLRAPVVASPTFVCGFGAKAAAYSMVGSPQLSSGTTDGPASG